jgi:DNA processing protein
MAPVKVIDIENENYPELLKKIINPPKVLYVVGNVYPEENCFAVVGSRQCSFYGKRVASEISGDLTESGLTIVSGLAQGIDAAAHQAVLKRKKRTIAVLGTGIDEKSFYPKENINLAKEILKNNGCLISEYPPGTAGSRFSFPQRNRIISGLSLGILVVEAKEKSGSLIAAQWAQKQEKKIFSVPGGIYFSNSRGTNFLIKNGAILTESANDILKELDIS